MRKDVKLGFTIGGILLAVVIAYVLVVPERDPSEVHLLDADGNPIVAPNTEPIRVGEPSPLAGDTSDDADSSFVAEDDNGEAAALVPPTADDEVTEPTASTVDDANESVAEVTDAVASAGTPPAAQADVDWEALLGGGEVLMTRTPSVANQPAAPLPPTEPEPVVEASELTSDDVNPPVASVASRVSSPTTRPMTGGSRTHTVQSGETLSSISKAAYGSANYYPHIIRANPGLNPSRMKVGTSIVLPDISDVVPSEGDARATAAVDGKTEYRVQSGDSLYSISTKLYGSAARMSELYELNKQTIGPDAGKLKLNMVLKLPAPPAAETASR